MLTYRHLETTALKCKDWRPVGPQGYGCKGYLLNTTTSSYSLFTEQHHLFLLCLFIEQQHLFLLCLFIEHHLFLLYLFTEQHHLPPEVLLLGIHCSDQVLAWIWRNSMGSILEAGCRPSREGTMPSSPLHQEGLQDKRDRMHGTHAPGAKPTTTAGT